jgi:D-ribose pyranose/furanose isomerase RbsD
VDLAVTLGVPTFGEVLDTLAAELEIELATLARRSARRTRPRTTCRNAASAKPEWVTSEDLKTISTAPALFVRNGFPGTGSGFAPIQLNERALCLVATSALPQSLRNSVLLHCATVCPL